MPNPNQVNEVKYVPAGTGPRYWGPGDSLSYLVTGAESGGAYFIFEVLVPPGGGVPSHIHRREDESFYLLEGTLTVDADGRRYKASAGDFIHLPRGKAQCFRNQGDVNVKMVATVSSAGLETFFEEAFYPGTSEISAPPPLSETLMGRIKTSATKHELELLRPA
jgi:quercetin dioxygenase-like cupin family protein